MVSDTHFSPMKGKVHKNLHAEVIHQICQILKIQVTHQWLWVSVQAQKMYYYDQNSLGSQSRLSSIYEISTGKKGISQIQGSEGTPLGLHRIIDKIGEKAPMGTVFVGRKNTGKIIEKWHQEDSGSFITSRILRLTGLQDGYNSGGICDSYNRYIYIHGIPDEKKFGIPSTHGCIGMLDRDIIELFSKIDLYALVFIEE